METTINLKIEQDGKIFEFEIDNSTNFKDFNLTISKDGSILRTLQIQNSTEEKTLEIARTDFRNRKLTSKFLSMSEILN